MTEADDLAQGLFEETISTATTIDSRGGSACDAAFVTDGGALALAREEGVTLPDDLGAEGSAETEEAKERREPVCP